MPRVRIPECMDDAGLDPREHDHALRSLNRANRWLGVDRAFSREIRPFANHNTLSVLDLGIGGGGFLAYMADHAPGQTASILLGLDRSMHALTRVRLWHQKTIRLVAGDARSLPLADKSVDVVTCSLFLHHFDPDDATLVLRDAARVARRGLVIGDLSRSRWAWWVTWAATRVLSRSRVFHVDGPRSVRAAYRADELRAISQRAGLVGAVVRTCFPFRLMLTWNKQ